MTPKRCGQKWREQFQEGPGSRKSDQKKKGGKVKIRKTKAMAGYLGEMKI